jgi:chromosome segregation ATPase
LRHEREQLAESHTALQQRYNLTSERVETLKKALASTQASHDERRYQLDLQIAEIADLKRELAWRDEELEHERRKASMGSELAAIVDGLEREVNRVRDEARAFARQLDALKDGKGGTNLKGHEELAKARRMENELRTYATSLDEQNEEYRRIIKQLTERLDGDEDYR